ncbi:DUF131 domain-containing protein, partial [Candidatus Woesearchaeota archaeon]|nr:DUF131 domain-containing protein [Candidatus Woesearchaeota archaeon]
MPNINLIAIGMLVIFLGILLIIIGSLQVMKESKGKTETKVAIGGFFGPIPFGFANDKQFLYIVLGISIFFFLLWLLFFQQ